MAKPSWLTTTPSTGSGNGVISNSASVHTGRLNRTGTVTVTPAGAAAKTYDVTQTAKPEFVAFDSESVSVAKTGGTLTVTGKSNSKKLTFSIGGTNEIGLSVPTTYTAAGATATSGTNITGDPGGASQYAISVAFSAIAANLTVSTKTTTLIVTDDAGNSAQIAIMQTAGDASLTISPLAITIPADGTAQTVNVTSNTTWSVS